MSPRPLATRRARLLAVLTGLALVAAACADRVDPGDTALGYPTTVETTTTLPPAATIAETEVVDDPWPASIAPLESVDWHLTGRRSSPAAATVSVTEFGAVADDGQPDTEAFAAAIQFAGDEGRSQRPTSVTVPPGRFLITETLALQSNVALLGSGKDATFLDLDLGGRDIEGITMVGAPFGDGEWTTLENPARRGDNRVALPGDLTFATGQLLEIEQDNVDRMHSRDEWIVEWGQGSAGELVRVIDGGPGLVVVDHGLFESYDIDRSARIRPISAIERTGIESMRIERLDEGYGHTVSMRYATDAWVIDVELVKTSRAHVGIDVSHRCEVSGSDIHGAHDYGDGGRAYGISVARHVTSCAFDDNALWDLRHALIIQLGATGNVFSHNDARGSAGYDDRQPRADISIHGHWPQVNLFEANVVDRIVFADWWGPSGPDNVFYRGCALEHVIVTEQSNDQLVLASVIGPGGLVVDEDITGTIAAANVVDGAPIDDLVDLGDSTLPNSLFRDDRTPPTVQDCSVAATSRNPWSDPEVERP